MLYSFSSQVDTYLADPNTYPTNRMITQAYKDGVERGFFVQPTVYPNFLPNRSDLAMYFVKKSDLSSYDPSVESRDQQETNSTENKELAQLATKSNIWVCLLLCFEWLVSFYLFLSVCTVLCVCTVFFLYIAEVMYMSTIVYKLCKIDIIYCSVNSVRVFQLLRQHLESPVVRGVISEEPLSAWQSRPSPPLYGYQNLHCLHVDNVCSVCTHVCYIYSSLFY